MKRSVLCLVAVLVAGGMFAQGAVAGGWAVVELAEPIPTAIAGKSVTIEFRVLQHGRPEAALADLDPVVTLMHRESKERTRVEAVATRNDPTRYVASFTLKETGSYKWNIAPDPFAPTAMPTLWVYATAAEAQRATTAKDAAPGAAVSILEGSYAPARLIVAPGTTVEWTNTSVVPHQVVWSGVEHDDSAIVSPDDTFRLTFDKEGTFTYYCGPHPWMIGEIVVAEDTVGS